MHEVPAARCSRDREDPSERLRKAPHQQLETRWLFHVFMSRWRSIKFDQCSLGPILCVVCSKWERLKEEKSQRQRRTCMYSSVSGRYCVSSTCGSRYTPHNILYHFLSALLALCRQWAHINSLLLSRKDIFFHMGTDTIVTLFVFFSVSVEMMRLLQGISFSPLLQRGLSCGLGIMGLCFRDNETSSLNADAKITDWII